MQDINKCPAINFYFLTNKTPVTVEVIIVVVGSVSFDERLTEFALLNANNLVLEILKCFFFMFFFG